MRITTIYISFLLFVLFSFETKADGTALAQTLKHELPTYSVIYDDKRDPFKDATNAIALARDTNRNIIIEIGGNWCVWCQKMDVFLEQNPDIYQALHNNYVLLKINVSDTNENEAFMKSLPPVLGYPHIYVSTGAGKMLLSKDTGEFLDDDGEHSRNAWLTFIEKWHFKNNTKNIEKVEASE